MRIRVVAHARSAGEEQLAARGYDIAADGRVLIATTGLEGVPTITVIDTFEALLKAPR
jgi:hypothetical protein